MDFEVTAFWSYARHDDEASDGLLGDLRKALLTELRVQTAETFTIHEDRDTVLWGEAWETRIENLVDASSFFIPIISPGFLASEHCRNEFQIFLRRQQELGRTDLILPIYFVDVPQIEQEDLRDPDDVIIQAISDHNRIDWRDLRHSTLKTKKAKERIAGMAADLNASVVRSRSTVNTNREGTVQPEAMQIPSGNSVNEDRSDGFLENAAGIEEWLAELTVSIGVIGDLIGKMGSTFTDETASLDPETGARQRIAIFARIDHALKPTVDSIETEVENYSDLVSRAGGAVTGVLSFMGSQDTLSDEDLEGACAFCSVVLEMSDSSEESLAMMSSLAKQVEALAQISSTIRKTSRRTAKALRTVADSQTEIETWSALAREVSVGLGCV